MFSGTNFEGYINNLEVRKKNNTCLLNSSSVYISNQKQNKGGSCLLLIDPQVDFVEGSLTVAGAKDDCKHIASFIEHNLDVLQEIYVTLDSHMSYHIAHPMFWVDENGKEPAPFTQITHKEVLSGKYKPADPEMTEWVKEYTRKLEKEPRLEGLRGFTLTIWPPHCLIGSRGHNVEDQVAAALQKWEQHTQRAVHYIMKGSNSKTEHYSAFKAEVEVKEDHATKFNWKLYNDLIQHSKIFVAGEAKSHCVNFTVRDLVAKMTPAKAAEKVVLLEGGMSSVGGCETQGNDFMLAMAQAGLKKVDISNGPVKALGFGLKSNRSCQPSKKVPIPTKSTRTETSQKTPVGEVEA